MTAIASPARVRAARIVALSADLIQIVVMPSFFPGLLSPLNNLLDVVVAAAMVLLLGWHPAFLPTFIAELLPMVDLFPTWTAAALFVTRRRP